MTVFGSLAETFTDMMDTARSARLQPDRFARRTGTARKTRIQPNTG